MTQPISRHSYVIKLFGFILLLFSITPRPTEAGFLRALGGKPFKGRYIVMLENVPQDQVDAVAQTLAAQYGGRVLGTMKHAMRGFGIAIPEASAIALSTNPIVKLVEEDEHVDLANESDGFDFNSTRKPLAITTNAHGSCAWNGSYYVCDYGTSDVYWNLDRLDNRYNTIYSYKAYGYTNSGQNVAAYVVDNGVQGAHSEFDGRVEAGANMMVDPEVGDQIARDDEEWPVNLDYWPAKQSLRRMEFGLYERSRNLGCFSSWWHDNRCRKKRNDCSSQNS